MYIISMYTVYIHIPKTYLLVYKNPSCVRPRFFRKPHWVLEQLRTRTVGQVHLVRNWKMIHGTISGQITIYIYIIPKCELLPRKLA